MPNLDADVETSNISIAAAARLAPMPGSCISSLKAATVSLAFSAKRKKASRSLTCAARQISIHHIFTKLILLRMSSVSRAQRMMSRPKQNGLVFDRYAFGLVPQNAAYNKFGLFGIAVTRDQLWLGTHRPLAPQLFFVAFLGLADQGIGERPATAWCYDSFAPA